jgi:hypothetical protein
MKTGCTILSNPKIDVGVEYMNDRLKFIWTKMSKWTVN